MKFRSVPMYMRYRIGAGLIVFLVIFAGWWITKNPSDVVVKNNGPTKEQRTQKDFAQVPTRKLDATQRRILKILKQEYTKAPVSYDDTVMKYTEGFRESWCADFITWVFNQADTPVVNSETNYWRIPGVVSLQQYYKDNDAYVLADASYTPQLGDVVFYIGTQTPDNSSDEHAAFVLGMTGDNKLITIGGNEADGLLRIRTESVKANLAKGMVGYGKLYL